MQKLLERLNRLRHSRGFGVHSPWAFRLITEAARPSRRYGYYAYPAIERLFGTGKEGRAAATVYRIAMHLQPQTVITVGDARWQTLGRNIAQKTGQGTLAIIAQPGGKMPQADILLFCWLDTPEGRRLWQQALDNPARTMAVDGHRRIGIVTTNPGLPRQIIDAWL